MQNQLFCRFLSEGELTRDVIASICDINVVISWSKGDILGAAAAVFVVSAVYL